MIQEAMVPRGHDKCSLIFFSLSSYHLSVEMEVVSGSALQSEVYKAPILWPGNYKEEDRKPVEPESLWR